MAAENESPAREPATRGRGRVGRGGRGGRGRGGGRGGASSTGLKFASLKPGRGGTRRGRAKSFTDSRVQAAYERQRDLKTTYQAVAHAIKPALQELAERSVDEILQKPDTYKLAKQHQPALQELQSTLEKKIAEHDRRLEQDLNLAQGTFHAETYVTEKEFENALDDMEEQFYEGQDNRMRIIAALSSRDLPVDIRDEQFQFKVISDRHLDKDFGIYECYKNGHLVPYPSRVKGTEMWRKVRDPDSSLTTTTSASSRGRGGGRGRGTAKRRAQDPPDGQPIPKKSTRANDDGQLLDSEPIGFAPAKGLLASAAEAEADREGVDEDSVPASPEPPNLLNGGSMAAQTREQSRMLAREKSPPLPKHIADPDDYGFRTYNQRPSLREKGIYSRVLAPAMFKFNDWEIGFRDTSNDSSKGRTRIKRGKYLDTPNSNGMHFDLWCNGYDYSSTGPTDFDQKLIDRYGLHPQYGMFMPSSTNESCEGKPPIMPGRPVAFIANPSGRVSLASRSFTSTLNHRRNEEAPLRLKFGASIRRFCKLADIDKEDISVSNYVRTDEELKRKSLRTALKELKGRPRVKEVDTDEEDEKEEVEEPQTPVPEEPAEGNMSALSVLTYASAFVEAQDVVRTPAPPPKPARYDAIRDVFTAARPAAPPVQEGNTLGLNFLAELCNVEARLPGMEAACMPSPAVISAETNPPSSVKTEEPPVIGTFNHIPPTQRQDPFLSNPRDRAFPQPPSSSGLQDMGSYPPPASMERSTLQPLPLSGTEYKSVVQGPPDHAYAYPPTGYPIPDSRESPIPTARLVDSGFNRRMSGVSNYSNDALPPSPYTRTYWPRHTPPGAPLPTAQAPPATQHYQQPPPLSQPPRLSFGQPPSAEPLPPLRPPRSRNQQGGEEPMHDSSMRSNIHGSIYYPPGPSRSYHRGYPAPEPITPLHTMHNDRILPNPQQSGHNYLGSPPPSGYVSQIMSPTFTNHTGLPGQLGQSPPGTPLGPLGSVHRHRSTLSGSSDAGSNKYRKLQPAPVPAHRSWPHKPELKTIPYDHKETGSSAALPSSGPTTIRGWNVNQPRKRSKAEKQDRADSANDREESR